MNSQYSSAVINDAKTELGWHITDVYTATGISRYRHCEGEPSRLANSDDLLRWDACCARKERLRSMRRTIELPFSPEDVRSGNLRSGLDDEPPNAAEMKLSVLLEAVQTFRATAGFHSGDHVFDQGACSRCNESYVRAEAKLDEAIRTVVLESDK